MSAPVQPVVHTPRPWLVSANHLGVVYAGPAEERIKISQVGIRHYQGSETATRRQAATIAENAKLIAAAPKMKDALRKFVAYHDADHESMSPGEIQAMYDAAIDAAKNALPEVV